MNVCLTIINMNFLWEIHLHDTNHPPTIEDDKEDPFYSLQLYVVHTAKSLTSVVSFPMFYYKNDGLLYSNIFTYQSQLTLDVLNLWIHAPLLCLKEENSRLQLS